MKYLLIMHMNPVLWQSLTEDEHNDVFQGHECFQKLISESGEMVETKALAAPDSTRTVRVRDGATRTDAGPFAESEAFLCGYYVVDVAGEERAVELAALIPDARHTAIEVRPVIHEAGAQP
ncbi:YciI family protein [Nonomuraea sp. JJY05]|uniref:YciI family protein n=1 Tax=Nonomuraea sp. JJY05 TaxID=3350255 RepID=UPI00373EEC28